jgi:hypothetical protein
VVFPDDPRYAFKYSGQARRNLLRGDGWTFWRISFNLKRTNEKVVSCFADYFHDAPGL